LAIRPPKSDLEFGSYREQLMTRIYVVVGENVSAMDVVERALGDRTM